MLQLARGKGRHKKGPRKAKIIDSAAQRDGQRKILRMLKKGGGHAKQMIEMLDKTPADIPQMIESLEEYLSESPA